MANRYLLFRVALVGLIILILLVSFHYQSPMYNMAGTKWSEAPKSNSSSNSDPFAPNVTLNRTQLEHLEDFHDASNSTTTPIKATKNPSYCPMPPPNLKGSLSVNLEAPPSLEFISRLNPDLDTGGHYKPRRCKSKDKVAIIVPYRDRQEHLRTFLWNIHPVLKRQMLEYNIFVIEQFDKKPFNRAMLFNVGFVEALKREKYDCFIFHDVDLLPENDRNLYSCPVAQPRHLSAAVDRHNYTLKYEMLFGGVTALRTELFKLVNGFSNVYWGWGAEDDDMANRIVYHGLNISRPSPHVGRYTSLKHKDQKPNKNRYKFLFSGKERFDTDGLLNLKYTVEEIILTRLFTLVRVKLTRAGGS